MLPLNLVAGRRMHNTISRLTSPFMHLVSSFERASQGSYVSIGKMSCCNGLIIVHRHLNLQRP